MTQKDAIKTLYPVYSKNTAKPVTEEEFRNRLGFNSTMVRLKGEKWNIEK